MSFKDALDHLELSDDILEAGGKLTLAWEKQVSGFDIFKFVNAENKPIPIRDDADYLKLFMQVAGKLFRETLNKTDTYLCACTLGGNRLIIKVYRDEERVQHTYSYIALSHAIKQIPEIDQPVQLNFYSEISYEIGNSPKFEKESLKVKKLLKGENQEDWSVILENKFDFLKTDMYVFNLLRLHSWGFQAINNNGVPGSKLSLVRPIKPKPRGAIRTRRNR